MCKHATKNLPYLLRYVLVQRKTQHMCDIAISENGGKLNSLPACYKNQQLCDKAVDNYPHTSEFVPDCYMTQKMCDKAVNTQPSTIEYVPDQFKTQEMCDEAIDGFLLALKFVPNWFITSKLIEKLLTASYTDENTLYFNEDSGFVVFPCNKIGIPGTDINNIIFITFMILTMIYDETIIHIRILTQHIKFEKRKALKRSEYLIPVAWYPIRQQNVFMSEDEKKEIEPIFTE